MPDDCLSINKDGTCKFKPGGKCLFPDRSSRGYLGNMSFCAPISKVMKIKQLYGKEAEAWAKEEWGE